MHVNVMNIFYVSFALKTFNLGERIDPALIKVQNEYLDIEKVKIILRCFKSEVLK